MIDISIVIICFIIGGILGILLYILKQNETKYAAKPVIYEYRWKHSGEVFGYFKYDEDAIKVFDLLPLVYMK